MFAIRTDKGSVAMKSIFIVCACFTTAISGFCVEDSNGNGRTLAERRTCLLSYGIEWLLNRRNSEWGWGERNEAESIIALHLADDHWFNRSYASTYISVKQMNLDLLGALSVDSSLNSTLWSRGKLAQYICAVVATCQNPNNFYGHNLIQKLQHHLDVNAAYFQTNKFALSWSILALCESGEVVKSTYKDLLAKSTKISYYGVDDAAMVFLALQCVDDSRYSSIATSAMKAIMSSQNQNGAFGNEFSTGLAIQALVSDGTHENLNATNAALEFLIGSLGESPWQSVLMATQVLPALSLKSYASINSLHCHPEATSSVPPSAVTRLVPVKISVYSSIASQFNQTWTISIPSDYSLLQTLHQLQNVDSSFSFSTESTAFGEIVTTLVNMFANTSKRMYWSLLKAPNTLLTTGVGETFPRNGDHFIFRLTSF